MTQEEKELLLRDLCGRLPYGVKVDAVPYADPQILCSIDPIRKEFRLDFGEYKNIFATNWVGEEYSVVKPYLRSLSSMTKEEEKEYENCFQSDDTTAATLLVDFYNKRHFDYRGLIEKGLALEAPDGMYNLNEK